MKSRAVIIVDDDDKYLSKLVSDLQGEEIACVGVGSGEEALRLVKQEPQKFQFAVVDHKLRLDHMDGIETTRELVKLSRNTFVLVFTNVPSDVPETIARFKYEAFSAGAFRYMEQKSSDPKSVRDFVDEIERLTSLSNWIGKYYEERSNVPSLLTQLDIGVDIIDRSHKVWFMNNAMRRIIGLTAQELPAGPCSSWHGYKFYPCPGCLVSMTFSTGNPQNRFFLSPLVNRKDRDLIYMNVWTHVIRDQKGDILRDRNDNPLAVMESVQELTGTAQLREMPLDERLGIIANALHERPVDGTYLPVRQFDTVRIFIRDFTGGDNFILRAATGFSPQLSLGSPRDLGANGFLGVAERNMQESGFGYFFFDPGAMDPLSPGTKREKFVYWPVMEGERTIAVLEVSGERCSGGVVEIVRSYAEEVRAAMDDADGVTRSIDSEVECEIAKLDLRLQTVVSPKDALSLLVAEACRLTDSYAAVLRYREGDEAVLLRLGLTDYGGYERVAEPRYSLTHIASWSARTIISGQEQLGNITSDAEIIRRSRENMSPEARQALAGSESLCYEPLFMEGQCIGALGLHSRTLWNYSHSEQKRRLIRTIARRVSPALHDYLVEQAAQTRVENTQLETIGLILHNINTPLGTIRLNLDNLYKDISSSCQIDPDMSRKLDTISRQVERIARIRSEFLKLQQPRDSRTEEVVLHKFLREAVKEYTDQCDDVSVTCNLHPELRFVKVDTAALRVCLNVMVQNSLDAFQKATSEEMEKKIQIMLRLASADELVYLASSSSGLAIDVVDNGPGVDPELIDDLFRIIRSRTAKGLGFGLTYCRHIARSARGDVYYHRNYRDGAKFSLILPFELSQGREVMDNDDPSDRR